MHARLLLAEYDTEHDGEDGADEEEQEEADPTFSAGGTGVDDGLFCLLQTVIQCVGQYSLCGSVFERT